MKKILLLVLLFIPSIVFASNNYVIPNYYTKIEIYNEKIKYQDVINIETSNYNVEIKKYLKENIKLETNLSNVQLKNEYLQINNGQNLNYVYYINYKQENHLKDSFEISIGNNFNTDIENTSFEISLPQDAENYNIEYYLDDIKLSGEELDLKIDSNKIIGTYNQKLFQNNKLYLKFNLISIKKTSLKILNIIIPIIFLIISYIIWFIFGKDRKIKYKNNQYPPKTLIPLEISLVYNNIAKSEDIIYNIIDLANKGYLKIVETKKNNYELIRIKDYDGKNNKESILYSSIFKDYSAVTLTEYLDLISKKAESRKLLNKVSDKELLKKFKEISSNTLPVINNIKEKNKYFEQSANNKKIYLILMVAIILLLNTCSPFYDINYLYYIPVALILSIFTLYQIIKFLVALNSQRLNIKNMLLYCLIFIAVWLIFLIPVFQIDITYLITYLIGVTCSILILILYNYMPKRTVYGSKQLSIIEGFKNYITKCSIEELEKTISDNPNYIYEVLPITYIIGINDIFMKKIKKIQNNKPDWFETEEFSIDKLNKLILKLNKNLKVNIEGE